MNNRVQPARINLFDDPVTITGTFLSVIAGLVSYLASEGDVVLGFVVGIQVEGLTLLIQLLLKQERRETRLGTSGELLATIESVDWLPEVIRSISADVARIEERYAHTVAPDAVRRVLDTCEAQLHNLARGHLYVDSYDPSLKLQLLARDASVLRTTSLQSSDLAWHLSEVGGLQADLLEGPGRRVGARLDDPAGVHLRRLVVGDAGARGAAAGGGGRGAARCPGGTASRAAPRHHHVR